MKDKAKIIQCIGWGICVVLAIVLIVIVWTDRKKTQERIMQIRMEAELQESSAEDSTNSQTASDENLKKVSSAYEDLIAELQMNSFVCWGDNEMAGSGKNTLPKAFDEVANSHLLDLLSVPFGEVIEKEKLTIPTMTVDDMSVSNEGLEEILVRAGVDELEVGEWVLISGKKEPVNIVLRNSNSRSIMHFAQQKDTRFGQVDISGVKGILTRGEGEYDEDHPRLAFLRDQAGDSFQVGQGTEVEIEYAAKYLGSIPIFFFEDNSVDTVDSADEFVDDLERLVQRYTEIEDEDGESSEELPYVVICTVDEDSELDDSLKEAFDDHYIRHDTYVDEMTEEGYKELAQKVYEKLDEQGCFDEMRGKIAKATEELKSAKE